MTFTDHCDLYGAVHENGINRVVRHLALQRPSLFNYATADVAANRKLWCQPVPHTSDVTKYGNPLFTIMPPLPLLGADSPVVTIGFIAQLAAAEIDFYPGNAIALPQELSPPLKNQRLALHLRFCAGLVCPSQKLVESIPVESPNRDKRPKPVNLTGGINCFCLDVYVVAHAELAAILGHNALLGVVDDVFISGLAPKGLEAALACYIKTTLNVVLREKLAVPLSTFMFSFPLFGTAITLSPTPNPPIPNNPAVEDDQLKVFVTMS
jgi:hypothetical protein